MKSFNIQKADPTDHDILTQITFEGKAFWSYSKEQLDEWKTELTISVDYIKSNETYKLLIDEETIGYYSFLKLEDNTIKLDYLFLKTNFIGKGFGQLLLKDFLEKVKKLNVDQVTLEADPNAEEFYKKAGFITYEVKKSSIEGRYLPLMMLKL